MKHSQVRRQKTVADRLTDIVRRPADSVARLQSGHSSNSSTLDGHTGTSCGRYRSRFDHTWNWQSITGRKTTAGNALNASRIRPVKQNNTQPYWRQTAGLQRFQHFAKRRACPDKWPVAEVYQSPLDGTEESLCRSGNSGIRWFSAGKTSSGRRAPAQISESGPQNRRLSSENASLSAAFFCPVCWILARIASVPRPGAVRLTTLCFRNVCHVPDPTDPIAPRSSTQARARTTLHGNPRTP